MTIEDEVKDAPVGGNNIVQVPVTVIIVDENDNVPTFQNVSCYLITSCTLVYLIVGAI